MVVLLATGVATWLVAANRARLSDGWMYGPGDGIEVANDGVTDTRWVVRPAPDKTFSLTTSVSNHGRVPITIERLARDRQILRWVVEATYVGYDHRGRVDRSGPIRDVTLRQEDWLEVHLTFQMPHCWDFYGEDGFTWLDSLRWRTRALGVGGVSETLVVPDLQLTVLAQKAGTRPSDCPPLGQ